MTSRFLSERNQFVGAECLTFHAVVSLPLFQSKSGLTACYGASIPKEALMRVPALAILTIGTVLTAAAARAQTYNPDYPVCLQVYDIDGATSHAAVPRWRSVLSRRRASPPSYLAALSVVYAATMLMRE
jgi:hypothetical protein